MLAPIAFLSVIMAAPYTAGPRAQTVKAFDQYVAAAESRIQREESSVESFLGLPGGPSRIDELHHGSVVITLMGSAPAEITGGLIHDWIGAVFIPNATIDQVFAVVQDYKNLARYYAPAVMQSRLISRNGDDFHIFLRTREHKVITVVLDTEYDVHYGRLDALHQFSFSRSTRVSEIADAGTRDEHIVSAADEHGYLWRLNSYWRFVQADDGVIVECEAISLTRGIPTGLGWLIGPYLRDIPRESLQSTLSNTRDAVERAIRKK